MDLLKKHSLVGNFVLKQAVEGSFTFKRSEKDVVALGPEASGSR